MKQEGNIVRVATIDTIKEEQKEKQDLIKAKYKSREQKKVLVPLVTVYLPINYSDIGNDIKPHLERDDTVGATVKFENIDLKLNVTPHVTFDKKISLNVVLKRMKLIVLQ